MGLLIKLNNGDTSLKSLKFGKDRPGGGNSNQPYIKKPISNQPLSALDGDGLLRGGLRAPLRALDDTARLSKYFFDFKNPSGLIFTAKQNLLSRIGTKTEVGQEDPNSVYSPNAAYAKGAINEGIYLPTSTILQAASSFAGGHLNKQGIDPTELTENLSITKYSEVAYKLNLKENNKFPEDISTINGKFNNFSNRLLSFWGNKQINILDTPSPSILYSYKGGAGSTLGIGETNIKYATMPDGITPVRTGTKNSMFTNIETQNEYLQGGNSRTKTYINYVDGVPVIQEYLDFDKFVPISLYGSKSGEINFKSDDNFGIAIGLNDYQSLFNRVKNLGKMSMDYSIKTPGKHPQKEKNIHPIKASSAYNQAIQPLIENTIEGFKIDYEKVKKEKIKALEIRIQNLENTKKNPFIGKKLKLKSFTPSQNFQSTINKSSLKFSSQLSNIQVTEFEEYTDLEKAAATARIDVNIKNLKKEITDLEAAQFNPDNIDGPLQVLSSGIGGSIKGLTRGATNFYFGDENRSVYKRGEGNKPTLVPRRDYINDLTPTLNEILSKRKTIYKANTTDERFPSIVLENRVHTGDPGSTNGSRTQALDKINAKSPYTGTTGKGHGFRSQNANDFAHFRIGIMDPFIPQNAAYMNFRALIEDISDNYSAEWNAQKYMGRAEKFYKYGGFDRKMSLSFKVVVMSQAEMPAIYSKLNYLASSLAPSYSPQGYMAGNIALLTLGDYVHEQYGIITSLDYKIPPDSSWELIIGEGAGLDELPFMIDVSMNFTPIHDFRPEVGNHNRYITKNMRLPYSGKPLKNIRDDEYTPEEIPPLPDPTPPPVVDPPPQPDPIPTTTPPTPINYAVVADNTRTNYAGQAAVERRAQDIADQMNQFKTPSSTNSNLGEGALDYFSNNNVPGMDGNLYAP